MESKTIRFIRLDGIEFFKRGKVRDIYSLGDKFLIVSTDRISCFDVVLPTLIPHKGEILNKLSTFWFKFTEKIIPNHLITSNVEEFPEELLKYKDILIGRSMLVRKAEPIPFECVVRGYLAGSGWREYKKTQCICGIRLPSGLKEAEKLLQPIFTPATKEIDRHDTNVTLEFMEEKLGKNLARKLKEINLALYDKASKHAELRGIIIADTKFEFGRLDGEIDELLTPDSSRFWPKDEYQPGKAQPSFDKQFVRDWLESINWSKLPPAPHLPQKIVDKTA